MKNILLLFFHRHECIVYLVHYFGVYFFAWLSFLTTILMAFGRHVAIFRPHLYASKVQGRVAPYVVSLCVLCLFLLFIILFSVVLKSQQPLAYLGVLIPPMVIYTVYVYIRAHIHLKKIHTGTKDYCKRGAKDLYNQQITALNSCCCHYVFVIFLRASCTSFRSRGVVKRRLIPWTRLER